MATPGPRVPGPTPRSQNRAAAEGNPNRNNPLIQNAGQDVGAVPAAVRDVPDVKNEDLQTWVNGLYDTISLTDEDVKAMWESFSYKGFNRIEVLKQMRVAIPDQRIAIQAVVAIALRGPQQGSKLKLSNGKSLLEMGIPASGGQGTKILTCNKIQAATADLAAHFLKRMNAPKRLNLPLPGWLQFPSAGGIKLPAEYREQHIEFSRRFSALIGGVFQEQIYMQMEANSYLDPRLRLFD